MGKVKQLERVVRASYKRSIVMGTSALALFCLPGAAHASVPVLAMETLMQAETQSAIFLFNTFAPVGDNLLEFNYSVDTNDGSFSYQTIAGQMYDGVSLLLAGAGSYDAGSNRFDWATSGVVGSSMWADTGTVTWVGDPDGDDKGNLTVNGVPYGTAKGKLKLDTTDPLVTKSSGTLTITPTGGKPHDYKVTDTLGSGPEGTVWHLRWDHKLGTAVNLEARGANHTDDHGVLGGISFVQPDAVPEPGTWSLMLIGFAGLGIALRMRPVTQRRCW